MPRHESESWEEETTQEQMQVEQVDPEKEKESPIYMHFSDYTIIGTVGQKHPKIPHIVYKEIKNQNFQEFCEGLLALMEREQRRLYITVDVLLAVFLEETQDDIESAIKAVTEAAEVSGRHQVTWSTARYAPDLERHWPDINDLNTFVRNHNARCGLQALSLHKIFLQPAGNGQYVTFAQMYEEFFSKKSLGRTPTEAAAALTRIWLTQHFQSAYNKPPQPSDKQLHPLALPLPLGMSPDFTNDEHMLNILKSRGLYRGRRSRSATKRTQQRKGSHRTLSRHRSDSMVSGARREQGARSPNSVGLLERLLHRVARGRHSGRDPHGQERESARISEKISELYHAKCYELTQLNVAHESLKLEFDLLKERREVEAETEILRLKSENEHLRKLNDHTDKQYDRLARIKNDLYEENKRLYEDMEMLRLSKKERRAAKKKDRRGK